MGNHQSFPKFYFMKNKDEFSVHYSEKLDGEYDCIDRYIIIVFSLKLMSGGGLLDCYRRLRGGDSVLNTAVLMLFAGVMS